MADADILESMVTDGQGRTGHLDFLEKISAWLVHHLRKSVRLRDIDRRQKAALTQSIFACNKLKLSGLVMAT